MPSRTARKAYAYPTTRSGWLSDAINVGLIAAMASLALMHHAVASGGVANWANAFAPPPLDLLRQAQAATKPPGPLPAHLPPPVVRAPPAAPLATVPATARATTELQAVASPDVIVPPVARQRPPTVELTVPLEPKPAPAKGRKASTPNKSTSPKTKAAVPRTQKGRVQVLPSKSSPATAKSKPVPKSAAGAAAKGSTTAAPRSAKSSEPAKAPVSKQ